VNRSVIGTPRRIDPGSGSKPSIQVNPACRDSAPDRAVTSS
jgi:hypothetical protein